MSIQFPLLKSSAGFRYFTFFYLYAMQGVPAGFALTGLANYLAGHGVSAVFIGSFDALIGLPWIFQFIWGPLVDRYQYSRMGHRKHWLLFSQIAVLLTLSLLLFVTDAVKQVGLVMIVFTIHSFFASIQDTSVDATAISIVPAEQQGRVNAFMRSGWLAGIAIGAAILSTVLHRYGFFYAAMIQWLFLFCFTILTWLTKIERSDSLALSLRSWQAAGHVNPKFKLLIRRLLTGLLSRQSLKIFGLMAVVYLSLGTFTRAFSFHLIHNLGWDDNKLSILQGTWGSLVTILITLGGGLIADRIGPGRFQRFVTYGIAGFLILFDLLGHYWLLHSVAISGVILYSLADPMFSVAAMPVLMSLCLKKVEGSQFTAYMALVNLCDVVGAYLSGWSMALTTGPVVGLSCGLVILAGLIFFKMKQQVPPISYDII